MAASTSRRCRLLADIGGTNARFGWQADSGTGIEHVRTLPCAAHADIESAIRSYLESCGLPNPACASLAIATPVGGDLVSMTNHAWSFSIEALRERIGARRLCVVNDFTALALGVPALEEGARWQIGGTVSSASGPIAVVGPGTGLGMSGLLPTAQPGVFLPITGEGGHATVPAETEREFAVVQSLRKLYGHASAERVLSGPGLVDLYHTLATLENSPARVQGPGEVVEQWHSGDHRIAKECVSMFCALLGSVAGNFALALGARGGVYIGGGIVPRLGASFAATQFRERFEAKGRFRNYLEPVPVWVITAQTSPALAGAGYALDLGPGAAGRWALAA
ncbi:glucokinase [Ramlibacter albus]|uniref:Glucokinase n=1 Tax=Ramlibacter albus TaxID=2079448 RepID=A0A923MAC1_9BURK|nr:glucokinase [Ramlibacter albus]MBC5766758.1 glucokinase [Ramlibacter albus]